MNTNEIIHCLQKLCIDHLLWLRNCGRLSGSYAESEFLTGTMDAIKESISTQEGVRQGQRDRRNVQKLDNKAVFRSSVLHFQVACKTINTPTNYPLEIKEAFSVLHSQDLRRFISSLHIQVSLMTYTY